MPKYIGKDILNKERHIEREKKYLYLIARIYAVFILVIYPLYVTNEGYNNLVFRKVQIYWVMSIAFIVIFTCFYLPYRLGHGKPENFKAWLKGFGVPDWAALSFLIIMTLSCILSKYQDMVWLGRTDRHDGWLTYGCMIASYFILSRWFKFKKLDAIMFAVSSLILSLIGLLQFYGYDFLGLFPYTQANQLDASGNPRYSGFSIIFRTTLGNIDFLSAYVCMTIIAMGILYIKSKGRVKILYASASVMNFVLMIIGGADAGKMGLLGAMVLLIPYWVSDRRQLGYTFTMTSFWGFSYTLHHWIITKIIIPGWTGERPVGDIGWRDQYAYLPLTPILIMSAAAFVIGLALILYKDLKWPKLKTAQIIGAALLFVMIAGGLSAVSIVGPKQANHNIIYQASEVLKGNIEDEFGTLRGFVWKRAIKRVPFVPLLGTGTDTFRHAFGEANQVEARTKYGPVFDKAHNDFIQILLCNGIPGLLAYLAFIASLVLLSVKKSFHDDVALFSLGIALGYIIQSFFGIDTIIVTPIYWMALSLLRGSQLTKETVTFADY